MNADVINCETSACVNMSPLRVLVLLIMSYAISFVVAILFSALLGLAFVFVLRVLQTTFCLNILLHSNTLDQSMAAFDRWAEVNEITTLLLYSSWGTIVFWYLRSKAGLSVNSIIGFERKNAFCQCLFGALLGVSYKLLVQPVFLGTVDFLSQIMHKDLFPAVFRQLQQYSLLGGCVRGTRMTFFNLLLIIFIAPVVLEFMFRGLLYSSLRMKYSIGVSVLISGAIFALSHCSLIMLPVTFTTGVILGLLYEKQKSLIGPMTAHACINALAVYRGLSS